MTQCSQSGAQVKCQKSRLSTGRHEQITFDWGSRPRTTLAFDSDAVTSDAGLSVLRDLDGRLGITAKAAACFNDLRRDSMTVHPVERLVRETVYAYAAGYADANDHTMLAQDTFFTHRARGHSGTCCWMSRVTSRLEISDPHRCGDSPDAVRHTPATSQNIPSCECTGLPQ